MKKIAIIAAAISFLAACTASETPNPIKDGIRAKIIQTVGNDAKVTVKTFEIVDSTTFAEELSHRKDVIKLRFEQNRKLHDQYLQEGRVKTAGKKFDEYHADQQRLEGLEKIGDEIAGRINDIAYYDVKFSAEAKTSSRTSTFTDYYATVTPEGIVYNIQSSPNGLHKPMGHVIPGYDLLFPEQSAEDTGSGSE